MKKLEELLIRRKDYFLLEGVKRKIYQVQFEKIQKEILDLKLQLDIYDDELDLLSVKFNYIKIEFKEILKILQDTSDKREIKWLRKKYWPEDGQAEYVGQVLKEITNPWLKEKFEMHLLKREGYMDCPWPTVLNEDIEREVNNNV